MDLERYSSAVEHCCLSIRYATPSLSSRLWLIVVTQVSADHGGMVLVSLSLHRALLPYQVASQVGLFSSQSLGWFVITRGIFTT
jgi:hypothetical protein